MLAHISKLRSNGGERNFFCRYLLRYSTHLAAAQPQNHLFIGCLERSLGFSREEAISAAGKIRRSRFYNKDIDLFISYFENLGLDKTQIKTIASSNPRFLLINVEKTLKPKIRVLEELGLSGSDLVKVIVGCRNVLDRGLESFIRPRIEYLRQLLGSDKGVVLALKKFPRLFDFYAQNRMEPNVVLLKKFGFRDEQIAKFIIRNPRRIFIQNPDWIQDVLQRIENDYGIPRESSMFYYAIDVLSMLRKESIETKLETLRSFGWSDADIWRMFRNLPFTFGMSVDRMRKSLDFFMNELGYDSGYLASHPKLFSVSLDRRVKRRNEVLKILNERKLIKRNTSLHFIVCLPELKFVKRYLLPHKDEIPDVYRSYMEKLEDEKFQKI